MRLRIKIPTDLAASKTAPAADALAARIKELSNISGGAGEAESGNCVSCTKGQCTRHTTKIGVCTRQTSVLRRSERPLTPEEVKASLALSASVGGAHSVACSGSADGACGAKEKVKDLMKHSAGAKAEPSRTEDGDDVDEDEDDGEEEEEGNDEDEDNVEDEEEGEEEDEEGDDASLEEEEDDVRDEGDDGEDDADEDEDDVQEEDEDEEMVEAGVERSDLYNKHHAKKTAQRVTEEEQEEDDDDEEIDDEEEEGDDDEEEEEED